MLIVESKKTVCLSVLTATDVLNDIAWSAVLDETFYNNYLNDSSLTWQYFASHSGFFRNYPGLYNFYDFLKLPGKMLGIKSDSRIESETNTLLQ